MGINPDKVTLRLQGLNRGMDRNRPWIAASPSVTLTSHSEEVKADKPVVGACRSAVWAGACAGRATEWAKVRVTPMHPVGIIYKGGREIVRKHLC